MGDKLSVIELKNAYLQLHESRDLHEFQVARIGKQHYRPTHFSFGLTLVQKIIPAVV